MAMEWHSDTRERYAFCTISGEEVTVLHLVRFGWQAGGPKNWGGGRRLNTPYLDCTTTVLDLGSFPRARGSVSVRIKGETLGVVWGCVLFFFPNAFRTGIECGFHRASRSIAGRQGVGQTLQGGGNVIRGFYGRLPTRRKREFSPSPTASESHGARCLQLPCR